MKIDESSLTGESLAVSRSSGDQVRFLIPSFPCASCPCLARAVQNLMQMKIELIICRAAKILRTTKVVWSLRQAPDRHCGGWSKWQCCRRNAQIVFYVRLADIYQMRLQNVPRVQLLPGLRVASDLSWELHGHGRRALAAQKVA